MSRLCTLPIRVSPISFAAAAGSTPIGITPAQARKAYGFDKVLFGSVIGDGTGQVICISGAYDAQTLKTDVDTYCTQFGLPPCDLTIFYPNGLPKTDSSGRWPVEACLDVQLIHAFAPGAKIIWVGALSNGYADLTNAITSTLQAFPAISVVAMSWGTPEFSSETATDNLFSRSGVTFVGATGDAGYVQHPANAPTVVAVGGTTLSVDVTGNVLSETGWSGSGGGISLYESKPSYQSGIPYTARTIPDIAYNANPSTAYAICCGGVWRTGAGTSASTPAGASLVAISNQGRAINKLLPLDGKTVLDLLYNSIPSNFRDITVGNNGHTAGFGYDLVTGLGVPLANLVAPMLAGFAPVPPTPPTPPLVILKPYNLAFIYSASPGAAGKVLVGSHGGFRIDVFEQTGKFCPIDGLAITLSIQSGPAGGLIGGTLSVSTVAGTAWFKDITLSLPGSYVLVASNPTVRSASSFSVNVSK